MSTPAIQQPVFLCGMMGAGKSTVGQALATLATLPFTDLDREVETTAGKSIAEIFRDDGEPAFRTLESSLLLSLAESAAGVVALGGGALQNQHLVDHIKLQGWLVFLNPPIDLLAKRLHHRKGRPLLQQSDRALRDILTEKMEQRLPFYQQAHITVSADSGKPDETAQQILKKIRTHEGNA
ncbi:MAG: shikimate kinase [Balneolaceae bacterium]